MIWPLEIALPAVLVLAYLVVVALFIYLLGPVRSGPLRGLLRRAAFLGVLLAVGLSLSTGAWLFASGLVATAPSLSFDREQMAFAAVFVAFFAPFVAIFQLALVAVADRRQLSGGLQATVSTTPILCGAFAVVLLALSLARPDERFEQLLGIGPPTSTTNIVYEQETGFLYSHVVLTCRMTPEDAAEVLKRRPDAVTVTYDRNTRTLRAEYNED